jgi:hypothetical protein
VVRRATGFSLSQILSIGGLVVSLTAWAVRVEGRVDDLQRQHARDVATLKDEQQTTIRQTRDDLAYIRARLDRALEQAAIPAQSPSRHTLP